MNPESSHKFGFADQIRAQLDDNFSTVEPPSVKKLNNSKKHPFKAKNLDSLKKFRKLKGISDST